MSPSEWFRRLNQSPSVSGAGTSIERPVGSGIDRRQFISAAPVGWAGLTFLGAATPGMTISLSVRVVEAPGSKEKTVLGFEDFVDLARRCGYQAICLRASQAGIQTPQEKRREMRRTLDTAGLKVSMVTGDFDVASNNQDGPKGLRNIVPYLDLAEDFGCTLIRVCLKQTEDIPWARRAADQAKERKIRLAHQSHQSTLFETVEGSVDALKKIRRSNFGLIYSPANWQAAGEAYGAPIIRRVRPWIMNVYLQNHRLAADGSSVIRTWRKGEVRVQPIGLWDQGGIDHESVFKALHAIRYRGPITVHQAFTEITTPEEGALKSYQYLKALVTKGA